MNLAEIPIVKVESPLEEINRRARIIGRLALVGTADRIDHEKRLVSRLEADSLYPIVPEKTKPTFEAAMRDVAEDSEGNLPAPRTRREKRIDKKIEALSRIHLDARAGHANAGDKTKADIMDMKPNGYMNKHELKRLEKEIEKDKNLTAAEKRVKILKLRAKPPRVESDFQRKSRLQVQDSEHKLHKYITKRHKKANGRIRRTIAKAAEKRSVLVTETTTPGAMRRARPDEHLKLVQIQREISKQEKDGLHKTRRRNRTARQINRQTKSLRKRIQNDSELATRISATAAAGGSIGNRIKLNSLRAARLYNTGRGINTARRKTRTAGKLYERDTKMEAAAQSAEETRDFFGM